MYFKRTQILTCSKSNSCLGIFLGQENRDLVRNIIRASKTPREQPSTWRGHAVLVETSHSILPRAMLWQHGWGPRITGYSSWLTSTPDGLGLFSFYPNTQCWSNLRSFHHQIKLTKSSETGCWRVLVPAFGLGQNKQQTVHSPLMEEVFINQISREQHSAVLRCVERSAFPT